MATEAVIRLRNAGSLSPRLRVAILPRRPETLGGRPALNIRADSGHEVLELVEDCEYRYEWLDVSVDGPIVAEPEELFQPDTVEGRSGRLRPGLTTGVVDASLRSASQILGRLELDVHSRKLNYLSEYQWMLRDIANQMTELVMDRFAASNTRFQQDDSRDALTLYQRFAFLRSLIKSERFKIAICEIQRRPHTAWAERHQLVHASAGLRGDSRILRQLARGGSRTNWVNGPVPSIPAFLQRSRTEATHDTDPNRFVRFALEHWTRILGDMSRALADAQQSPATLRGQREVAEVSGELDQLLNVELFKNVSRMTRFPAGDQVLHKREGYRDIFRAYIEFELAARLSWSGSDTFSAGQRDIATLYEYWAFLQLSQVVADVCNQNFDLAPLVEATSDKLNVTLKEGVETVLTGEVTRNGRQMLVELWFNRTFGTGGKTFSSWTRPMRPDYSLIISAAGEENASFEPVVLHFDAKYKVAIVDELFGQETNAPNSDVDLRGGALRSDLLKMHAYRDAIRRTAGAYVLYPGGESEINRTPFKEYHELLPGLGAFVLRPDEQGEASGVRALRRFIDDVIDHVSTRLTRHERGRYWVQEAYAEPHLGRPSASVVDPTASPDIPVLVGFVKDRTHWQWIERRQVYNVRAEGRPGGVAADSILLRSQSVLLYSPATEQVAVARIISVPELVSGSAMANTGYVKPRGNYWCVQLARVPHPSWFAKLSAKRIEECLMERGFIKGEPVTMTWGAIRALAGDA